jgi:hypothetical protein
MFVLAGQDDGADLMRLERVPHARPRGVNSLVEERFFDGCQQMVCDHTKKNMTSTRCSR